MSLVGNSALQLFGMFLVLQGTPSNVSPKGLLGDTEETPWRWMDSGKGLTDQLILTAELLQKRGKERAVKDLRAGAAHHPLKVIMLCRMLFTQKPNSTFRRPFLGAPIFIAASDTGNWPLEPIAIVDGVPFDVTTGYVLAGRPESARSYVEYCATNCDWSQYRYSAKSKEKKRLHSRSFFQSK